MIKLSIEKVFEYPGEARDFLQYEVIHGIDNGFKSGPGWDVSEANQIDIHDEIDQTLQNAPESKTTPPTPQQPNVDQNTPPAPESPENKPISDSGSMKSVASVLQNKDLPWEKKPDACEHCGGTGQTVIPAHQNGGETVDEQTITCSICKGTGVKTNES